MNFGWISSIVSLCKTWMDFVGFGDWNAGWPPQLSWVPRFWQVKLEKTMESNQTHQTWDEFEIKWAKKSETSNREEEATLQKGGMSACTSGLVKKKRRQLGLFFKEDPGWRLFPSGPLDRAQAMQGRPCPIWVDRGQWELVWNMIKYYHETWWSMITHDELWWKMMK